MQVDLGILYSRSGGYALISEACRSGALRGIADVNASGGPVTFNPIERDPGGNIDAYQPLCEDLLRNSGARHIIGAVTSWSRKEIIPSLEKLGGVLWYACPYEGFEAHDRVIYTHACPNQHLLPLLDYVIPRHGARGFLVGSNYIWGWETNRVARDLIADARGLVLGERYLPLGDTDVVRLIAEIRATRPDFVLNTLIGPSSYAFYRAYAALGLEDAHFRPKRCPILSCNLTECELPALGGAGEGHISVGPWFRAAAVEQGWGAGFGSSMEAAAYASVQMLAQLLAHNPAAGWDELTGRLGTERFAAPNGAVQIDPQTQHTTQAVVIGRIRGAEFETLRVVQGVAPDPYLSRYDRAAHFRRPALSVVQ